MKYVTRHLWGNVAIEPWDGTFIFVILHFLKIVTVVLNGDVETQAFAQTLF